MEKAEAGSHKIEIHASLLEAGGDLANINKPLNSPEIVHFSLIGKLR
ncbi:MAG: hypothetical protein ACP5US_01775 [Candidatus Kryptoniota bacterium]